MVVRNKYDFIFFEGIAGGLAIEYWGYKVTPSIVEVTARWENDRFNHHVDARIKSIAEKFDSKGLPWAPEMSYETELVESIEEWVNRFIGKYRLAMEENPYIKAAPQLQKLREFSETEHTKEPARINWLRGVNLITSYFEGNHYIQSKFPDLTEDGDKVLEKELREEQSKDYGEQFGLWG